MRKLIIGFVFLFIGLFSYAQVLEFYPYKSSMKKNKVKSIKSVFGVHLVKPKATETERWVDIDSFDTEGYIRKHLHWDLADTERIFEHTYYYNNKMQLVADSEVCRRDSIWDYTTYQYDKKERLIRSKYFEPDSGIEIKGQYGQLIDMKWVKTDTAVSEYFYPDNNTIIVKKTCCDKTPEGTYTVIKLDEKQRVISITSYKNSKKYSFSKYIYDGNGNLVKERFYLKRKLYSTYIYAYDEKNLLLSIKNYDGKPKSNKNYTYSNYSYTFY